MLKKKPKSVNMELISLNSCATIRCQIGTFTMTLGTFVTQLREEKGWSRRELARRVSKITNKKISATHIGRIEEDETKSPGLELLLAIGEALGAHPMRLIEAYKGGEAENVRQEDISTHDYSLVKLLIGFMETLEQLSDEEIETIAQNKLGPGSLRRTMERFRKIQNQDNTESS